MSIPVWLLFAIVALVFWGITGVTQKLSTNLISTQLSFVWFGVAMLALAVVVLPKAGLHWHLAPKAFAIAVLGGALNSLGAYTQFCRTGERGQGFDCYPPLLSVSPSHDRSGDCFLARNTHPPAVAGDHSGSGSGNPACTGSGSA